MTNSLLYIYFVEMLYYADLSLDLLNLFPPPTLQVNYCPPYNQNYFLGPPSYQKAPLHIPYIIYTSPLHYIQERRAYSRFNHPWGKGGLG